MMLAEEVPEAREHMGSYGLAMVRHRKLAEGSAVII